MSGFALDTTSYPPRGQTFHSATATVASTSYNTLVEGRLCIHGDSDHSTAPSLRTKEPVITRLVRNVAATVLEPKRAVTYASDYPFKRVDGYSRTTAVEIAGIVDDQLTAVVQIGDVFHLVVAGPCECLTGVANADTNVLSVGSRVCALTAAASTGTGTTGVGGRLALLDTTGATTPLANQIFNQWGRALTAVATSGVTNSSVLIDLEIYKH